MTEPLTTTRRDVLALASALGIAGLVPNVAAAQQTMPVRRIPSTGEMLPVIGLGSSKAVSQIAADGPEPLTRVLHTLVGRGGSVIDTWPRDAGNDAAFGEIVSAPDLRERLFLTTKIDRVGKEAGIAQFRETQRLYKRETLDLVQIFSLTDLAVHWPTLQEWKAAGHARYIGVTVAEGALYEPLERFLAREKPDFIQVNYSITERDAEQRVLPLAQDRGVAVIVNRPFMNGAYFGRLEKQPLPEWAADFDCESWAQFSLKYILANPVITCVLTETTNPGHMEENTAAAFGSLPDAAAREKMRAFIAQV